MVKFRKIFETQRNHWTFFFLFYVLSLHLYAEFNWVLLLILMVLGIRILLLRRKALMFLLCLGGLLVTRTLLQQHQFTLQQNLNIEDVSSYVMEVDPLSLTIQESYLSGEAYVNSSEIAWQDLPVTFIYWLEEGEKEQLPLKLISEKVTTWQLNGQLLQPEVARNFHAFDYRDYLSSRGIAWQLEIDAIHKVDEGLLNAKNRLTLKQRIRMTSQNLRASLTQRMRFYEAIPWVGLHNKLLFNLDSAAYRNYRDDLISMGIVHYFAISGFHLFYIRRLLRYLLLRGGVTQEVTSWLVFLILSGYGWLIRWPVGVIRSMGVHYAYRLSRHYHWPFSSMDLLGGMGIALLLVNPLYSRSLGFVLSFLMTYLLKFYSQQANASSSRWRTTFEMTVVCLIFSWPLIMMQSFEWNFIQLVIVILFGLVFDSVIMPLVFLTTLLIHLPHTQAILQIISNYYESIWQLSVRLDWIHLTKVIVGMPGPVVLLCLVTISVVWLYLLKQRPKLAYCQLVLGYLIVITLSPLLNPTDRLTILDVDQGDALLYQPAFSREAWLIDTGGRGVWGERMTELTTSFDLTYAERDLIPSLKALGVSRLTGVIITHPDMDHMGNLPSLSQALPIGQLIITSYISESSVWDEMQPALAPIKDIQVVEPGEIVRLKDVPMLIISLSTSSAASYYAEDNANDSSLAVLISIGEEVLLNLGDLSMELENKLLREVSLPAISLIKLGHHGSNTSTSNELLTQLEPQLALISAGKDNRYGFPHPEVLERLASHEVPYLSTDRAGAIQITYHYFHGHSLRTAIGPEE